MISRMTSFGSAFTFYCVLYSLPLGCFATAINKPAMDKIFFLLHRTTQALNKLEVFLNNKSIFASIKSDSNLTQEGNIVLGGEVVKIVKMTT